MTMTDYISPADVLFVGPGEDDQMIVIAADPHECGWQERIWYFTLDGDPVRSGCAGCEADRPVAALTTNAPPIPEELCGIGGCTYLAGHSGDEHTTRRSTS